MRPVDVAACNEDQLRDFWPYRQTDEVNYRFTSSTVCCTYDTMNGECISRDYSEYGDNDVDYYDDWDGVESIEGESGAVIGLLLDLDNGTLTVFKNGKRLGVMTDRLAGNFCWMAYLRCWGETCGIAIERKDLPE